jgi:hypothetical protein
MQGDEVQGGDVQGEELRRVVLVNFPLRVARRAYQHREALLREFAIITYGGGEQADVPKRLIEIAKMLDERYSGLNPAADAVLDAAARSNVDHLDLELMVPTRIKGDTIGLTQLLLEADEYCRSGGLLTLSPTDEMRSFWVWFLREFVRQTDGEAPRPWRDVSTDD